MNTASDWNRIRQPRASQLCKHLLEILSDSSPLSMLEYFIQFMESVGAVHLVQFWFCVESFKSAVTSTPVKNCEDKSCSSQDSYPLQKTHESASLQGKSEVSWLHDVSRLESEVTSSLNNGFLQTGCEFDERSSNECVIDESCSMGGQCGQSTVSHCLIGKKLSGSDIVTGQVFTECNETGTSVSRQKSLSKDLKF